MSLGTGVRLLLANVATIARISSLLLPSKDVPRLNAMLVSAARWFWVSEL
jgi:hypothetical protein